MTDAADNASSRTEHPRRVERLGFAGTPEFAATIAAGLIAAGRTPHVIYTQPDRPTGRGRRVRPSPVKVLAESHGIPVEQPATLRTPESADTLEGWALDVLVVAAYGLILPPRILSVPRFGCINVHASLLPRWRGAAPIERAIMAGDHCTGVCIMAMEKGLDTGPVYLARQTPIGPDTDAPTLEATLAELGTEALLTCLLDLPERTPTPQGEQGVTYADKLSRDDAVIHWAGPAPAIAAQVRALTGRMPAFTLAHGGPGSAGQPVRIAVTRARVAPSQTEGAGSAPGTVLGADRNTVRVACGDGVLEILEVHVAGRPRPMAVADVLRGQSALFQPGAILRAPA